MLKKFMTKYPKIQLDIEIAERMPNFTEDKMDILFGVSARLLEKTDDLVQKN